jgi:hypothetical protein
MYLVIGRGTDTFLEKVVIEPNGTDPGFTYITHLDRRLTDVGLTGSFDANTGESTINLPYDTSTSPTTMQVVIRGAWPGWKVGEECKVVGQTGYQLRVKGNIIGVPLYMGFRYEMKYRFSTPILRQQSPFGGVVGVTTGRLQLRTFYVTYAKTGYFRVEIAPLFRDTAVEEFTGRVVGSSNNVVGEVPLESGTFRFMVNSRNDQVSITLVNDSFLPCRFVAAEWEGLYQTRSRRL